MPNVILIVVFSHTDLAPRSQSISPAATLGEVRQRFDLIAFGTTSEAFWYCLSLLILVSTRPNLAPLPVKACLAPRLQSICVPPIRTEVFRQFPPLAFSALLHVPSLCPYVS
jgi:hypothetical protein